MIVRKYEKADLQEMTAIWNRIVEDGMAFPQEELLTEESASEFFGAQTYTGVAVTTGGGEASETEDRLSGDRIVGLYILHPNNVGRSGHIANASYAVDVSCRGQHIGEKLVLDSLEQAKKAGFRVLQFNAVVESNIHARHLYERLGFKQLGTIPGGFRMKDGHYANICPYYRDLSI